MYKPTFVIGDDGKIKIAQSLQCYIGYPSGFVGKVYPSKMDNYRIITQTMTAEYLSISDIEAKGATLAKDAYIDIYLYLTNERESNTRIMFFPSIRSQFKFKPINFKRGDDVYVVVLSNTRSDGVANIQGIVIDERE